MKRSLLLLGCFAMVLALGVPRLVHVSNVNAAAMIDWPQWGRTAQHSGSIPVAGQSPSNKLASLVYDPFTNQEKAETFDLLVHYQSPLVDGSSVIMEVKSGTYVSCQPPGSGRPFPCGPDAWNQEIWNENAYQLQGSSLVQKWSFQSDWKPEPNARNLGGWEPVFHAALANGFVFVP